MGRSHGCVAIGRQRTGQQPADRRLGVTAHDLPKEIEESRSFSQPVHLLGQNQPPRRISAPTSRGWHLVRACGKLRPHDRFPRGHQSCCLVVSLLDGIEATWNLADARQQQQPLPTISAPLSVDWTQAACRLLGRPAGSQSFMSFPNGSLSCRIFQPYPKMNCFYTPQGVESRLVSVYPALLVATRDSRRDSRAKGPPEDRPPA